MLVTSPPDELLEPVRSRCQRIDLAPLPEAALRDALVHERADPEAAELAARLAGGRLDRGRAMLGVLGDVRRAFVTVAAQLDGTGGSAVRGGGPGAQARPGGAGRPRRPHPGEGGRLGAAPRRARGSPRSPTAPL